MPDNLNRRALCERRKDRRILACAIALFGASTAFAQAPPPDSAAIYERLTAKSIDDTAQSGPRDAMRYAKRAAELYAARGDDAGQARALVGVADVFGFLRQPDSALVHARKALSILRRANTDLFNLAEANAFIAQALMLTMAPMDSATVYRAESMRLYARLPGLKDRRAEGRATAGMGNAFLQRERMDAAFLGKPDMADSALKYFQASVRSSRFAADSLQLSGTLGLIANVWASRGRYDLQLLYRQQAFEVSSRVMDYFQFSFDARAIIQIFRSSGVNRNLDSALHWSRRYFQLALRFGLEQQLTPALQLSSMHAMAGKPDSARYYIDWTIAAARKAGIPRAESRARNALARWYEDAGLADSALMLRREDERRIGTNAGATAAMLQQQKLNAWAFLASAHATRGNLDSLMYWSRLMLDSAVTDSLLDDRISAYANLASVFLDRGQPDSALAQYAAIDRETSATTLRMYGALARAQWRRSSWLRNAHVLFDLGLTDSAQTLTERFASETRVVPSVVLEEMAKIQRFRGRPDSALALDRQVLRIAQNGLSPVGEARAHQAIGEDFDFRGSRDSSLAHYRAAVDLDESRQFRPNAVASLGALASWYLNADAPDSALALNRRAAALAAKTSIPRLLADVRYRSGIAFGALGQWDSAVVNLQSALQQPGQARLSVLVALGGIRLRMGETDTAAALLRTALGEYRTSKAKPAVARTLALLAGVESGRKRPEAAQAFAQEALQLSRESKDVLTEGRSLAALGRAQFALGQSQSARTSYERGLKVLADAGFTRDARETLAELAELFRTRKEPGDLAVATAYFDSAAATVDNARRRTGDDENAVAFVEQQTDVFGGWARAWIGRHDEVGASRSALAALGAVERGRAQSLLELLQRDHVASQARVQRSGSDLAIEADSLLAGVRAAHGAALSYLHAGDTLFVWFVPPDGRVELLPPTPITEAELGRLVRSARRSFEADDARSIELNPDELGTVTDSVSAKSIPADDLKRLAELLLPADFAKRVSAGTPIVIVPHGAIALVPFAALETSGRRDSMRFASEVTTKPGATERPDARALLGLRNPLRYAPSFAALNASLQATSVATAQSAPPPTGTTVSTTRVATSTARTTRPTRAVLAQSLVVGNPTMPYVYSGRSNNRAQLRPLPGAEAESRTIAHLLGARVFTGKAATETMVRSRMANAPLIHFATHGLGFGTHTAARRSYVAFAPDSLQDGLLTLGELMDDRALTLKADLVVLSACQTGLGDLKKAEGSIGLQRAFLAKGARSVLVSLWNVDDRATRLLMEKFYGYWLDPVKPRSKAEALQLAQNDVRNTKGFFDPKYWAAFQLVGGN